MNTPRTCPKCQCPKCGASYELMGRFRCRSFYFDTGDLYEDPLCLMTQRAQREKVRAEKWKSKAVTLYQCFTQDPTESTDDVMQETVAEIEELMKEDQ